jgi:hypothetical protein
MIRRMYQIDFENATKTKRKCDFLASGGTKKAAQAGKI